MHVRTVFAIGACPTILTAAGGMWGMVVGEVPSEGRSGDSHANPGTVAGLLTTLRLAGRPRFADEAWWFIA